MSRSARLLSLLQLLREHKYPVSGETLAEILDVSVRTIYRDIATLQDQGACIEGEAGLGFVLKPGFTLPPLMFSPNEIEALLLGCSWVERRTDSELSGAATSAFAKIENVLPSDLHVRLSSHLLGPGEVPSLDDERMALLRDAVSREHKILVTYEDAKGDVTERTLWPIAIAYFDQARILVAWCALRKGFRHFRLDRIASLCFLEERYERRRHQLLKEWRESLNAPDRN